MFGHSRKNELNNGYECRMDGWMEVQTFNGRFQKPQQEKGTFRTSQNHP